MMEGQKHVKRPALMIVILTRWFYNAGYKDFIHRTRRLTTLYGVLYAMLNKP